MTMVPIWRSWRRNPSMPRSRLRWLLVLLAALVPVATHAATTEEIVIVAFGDSLTAGLGLPPSRSFPAQLEQALRERGHNVRIVNAGVSGDTAASGLQRLDWALPPDVDAVIVELGANDALRGLDPQETRQALTEILDRLQRRGLPVLLAGMQAPRNMGPEYEQAFDAIYPALAADRDVLFYPFFLEGVATRAALNQADGIHPNAEGVAAIVTRILPLVETLIARAKERDTAGTGN